MNQIEEIVQEWLVSKGIYPFSVLYSKYPQFLKLSFFLDLDIDELLKKIGYQWWSDVSGVQIFKETRTILMKDIGLINFLRYVDN